MSSPEDPNNETTIRNGRYLAEFFDTIRAFKWWNYSLDIVDDADPEYAKDLAEKLVQVVVRLRETEEAKKNEIDLRDGYTF
jgi:hypothetical protein